MFPQYLIIINKYDGINSVFKSILAVMLNEEDKNTVSVQA